VKSTTTIHLLLAAYPYTWTIAACKLDTLYFFYYDYQVYKFVFKNRSLFRTKHMLCAYSYGPKTIQLWLSIFSDNWILKGQRILIIFSCFCVVLWRRRVWRYINCHSGAMADRIEAAWLFLEPSVSSYRSLWTTSRNCSQWISSLYNLDFTFQINYS